MQHAVIHRKDEIQFYCPLAKPPLCSCMVTTLHACIELHSTGSLHIVHGCRFTPPIYTYNIHRKIKSKTFLECMHALLIKNPTDFSYSIDMFCAIVILN